MAGSKLADRARKAHKELTAAKAKGILHDGTVHGQLITPRQRRFFGAVASGQAMKGLHRAARRHAR